MKFNYSPSTDNCIYKIDNKFHCSELLMVSKICSENQVPSQQRPLLWCQLVPTFTDINPDSFMRIWSGATVLSNWKSSNTRRFPKRRSNAAKNNTYTGVRKKISTWLVFRNLYTRDTSTATKNQHSLYNSIWHLAWINIYPFFDQYLQVLYLFYSS